MSSTDLHFHVNDIPNPTSILLFGLQQMMICFSSLLVVPYVVSDILCAGENAIQIRVQLISATFVTSGIATILQTTFGMRLSILHGPSFAFLPALHTFQDTFPCDANSDPDQWREKLQMIMGSCLLAVLIMPILGLTGLIGRISHYSAPQNYTILMSTVKSCRLCTSFKSLYIGPITIVPIMCLLTIGIVPDIEQKMALHWISIVELVLLVIFIVLLGEWEVPLPLFSFKNRKFYIGRHRILSQFPYLLGIIIAWFICFIMTVTNLEPPNGAARTDNNASLKVLDNTPWVQIPLPGAFGAPKLNIALICGFMASCLAATIESIGDYNLCAKISHQGRPPASNVNRAFVVEGIGCILAALMGVGSGVTTYAENIAIMQVTKVTSRITMQLAGLLLILAGIFSKLSAFLALIPEAIIGGLLACGISMIGGVSLSNLQTVDLRISRNLTIMGIAIILGCTIPHHFEKHPMNTGVDLADDVFGTLLKIRMLVGGVIAFILDNITGGATRAERGFLDDSSDEEMNKEEMAMNVERNGYIFPSSVNQFFLRFRWLTYLPIIPSESELLETESMRSMKIPMKNGKRVEAKTN